MDKQPVGVTAVSLRTLFFITFVSACVARWLARYGMGLAVGLVWCALIGAIVAAVLGTGFVVLKYLFLKSLRHNSALQLTVLDVSRVLLVGALVGFIGGSTGFALATMGPIDQLTVNGMWFSATFAHNTKQFDITADVSTFMLLPAIGFVTTSCIARLIAVQTANPLCSVAASGCVMAAILAIVPPVFIVLWLVFFPPAPTPPGVGHENMLGLLPIAVLIWSFTFACVGAVAGTVAGSVWAWIEHSSTRPVSRAILWCMAVIIALLVTEAALRGWVRDAAWWARPSYARGS